MGDGKRIIVDNIPKRDLVTGELEVDRSIQIYKNPEGFLVADEVRNDQPVRMGTAVIDRTPSGDALLSGIIPGAEDINNSKKDLPNGEVELIGLDYKFPLGGGSYSSVHISISCPTDQGNSVKIAVLGIGMSRLPEPILIREVAEISSK